MPITRESLAEFDKTIAQAQALKERIITFREGFPGGDLRQTKTLQLLESAADHIIDNLTKMKQRVLTNLGGG